MAFALDFTHDLIAVALAFASPGSAWDSVPEADQSLDRLRERLLREETQMTSDDDVTRAFATTTISPRSNEHHHQANGKEKSEKRNSLRNEPREEPKHESDLEDFVDVRDGALIRDLLSLANEAQKAADSPARNLRPRDTMRAPERYQANVTVYYEPKNYQEALACADAELWKHAIDEEMRALENNNT
ncbi:unnamed protein product [Trichogramma brassicae]|uniref:Uncharacterized protein n=1 Tax=Trichogramma brassicae TaxID=86971 RepID=A0A6H5IS02_9HYME|nr:unnamed protein product [Trichogramma brassicae]